MNNIKEIIEPDYFSKQIKQAKRFYRNFDNQQIPSQLKFQVVAAGRETCSPGYRINRPTFPYHTLEFITRGRGTLKLQGKKTELNPGTVFYYGPGIYHEIYSDKNDSLEKYFVNIKGEKAAYFLEVELALSGRVFHTSTPNAILQTYEELIQYGLIQSPWTEKLCSSLAETLIYKIASSAIKHGDSRTEAFATFKRCKNSIAVNYGKYRSLEAAAEDCSINPAYLCRLFKKFDHQSPYQYILRLQMNYAADRLLDDKLQIQEIAFDMGFENPQHFSRTFKKVIGFSPTELIKQSLM